MPTATPLEFSWKVGDKAFYEYKEVTLHEVEEGRVYAVCDGKFITSGSRMSDHLFPITESGREVVAFFYEHSATLRSMRGWRLLNWPGISSVINEKFEAAMRLLQTAGEIETLLALQSAERFFDEVKQRTEEALNVMVEGVPVFNQAR